MLAADLITAFSKDFNLFVPCARLVAAKNAHNQLWQGDCALGKAALATNLVGSLELYVLWGKLRQEPTH